MFCGDAASGADEARQNEGLRKPHRAAPSCEQVREAALGLKCKSFAQGRCSWDYCEFCDRDGPVFEFDLELAGVVGMEADGGRLAWGHLGH
jgi:hypothetical protein